MQRDILVSEVGPRDGLQSIKTIMPLAAKKVWISALAASGLREIEVGSFVPAQAAAATRRHRARSWRTRSRFRT